MMDSLEFLEHVWRTQREGISSHISCFAFLSLRQGPNDWRDLAFKWGYDEIELPDATYGDVYFCPNLFSRPRRRKELVLPSVWLYADLDAVCPVQNDAEMSPTIAWESSPERYQALWELDRRLGPAEHQDLNRKLTYALGADRGGWDITQVLRVPGTLNHKYKEKPEVKLLWQ